MPTDFSELAGKTALVTGASSGLGVEFARQLANAGCHLIITARREDRLVALKEELATSHPEISVDVIVMDLAGRDAAQHLYAEITGWERPVDILINNAGYGIFGWFLDSDWDELEAMIRVNTLVPQELTHLFGRDMVERGYGKVLIVSSMIGFQATPTYAAYASAKSLSMHFGEALNLEFRGSGVTCTVLSPGVTRTEFLDVAGQKVTFAQRLMMMEGVDVVRVGLSAMLKGKANALPGWLNKTLIWSSRLTPRAWVKWVAYATMRNEDVSR